MYCLEKLLKNKPKQLKINEIKNLILQNFLKQLPSKKDFISKERLNSEIMGEHERIEEEKKSDRNKMVYKGYNKTYNFRKFRTRCTFGTSTS